MTTPGIDFFRVDRSGPTRRLLVAAVLMVTCGATAVGAHLVKRLPVDVSHTVSLVGGITMIAGLVMAFGAMAMILFENVYLAIEDEGLLLHDDGRDTRIPWEKLVEVHVDPKGFVELRRADHPALRWFAGKSSKDVAARLLEAKRKAAHGLLRAGSTPPVTPAPPPGS
jgi:hypothetical protein